MFSGSQDEAKFTTEENGNGIPGGGWRGERHGVGLCLVGLKGRAVGNKATRGSDPADRVPREGSHHQNYFLERNSGCLVEHELRLKVSVTAWKEKLESRHLFP